MADLVTNTYVKLVGGISVSTYDSKLDALITAASRMVERYCDRQFISVTYTEVHSGRSGGFISLDAYPVTGTPRVRVATPVMEIRNTDTTNNEIAHVSFGSTSVTVHRTNASGSASNSVIAYSGCATIGLLGAAIEALGNGWDVTVESDYTGIPPADIRHSQGTLDALNDTAQIEAWVDFNGYQRTDNSDYAATVWGDFPEGTLNLQVIYLGGYSSIPEDVQLATADIVLGMHRGMTRDSTLRSEKLGDYSYQSFSPNETAGQIAGITPTAAALLQPFRQVRAL